MTLGGRPPELVQQARDGVVDIIWTVNGYTPGMFPRSEVFELPTVFTNDPEPVNLALFDLFEADLKPDYAGLQVMFLSVHAGNAIHMRNKAIRSPTDLAGKKIRTPSRTGAWSIEALGGIPIAMPVPDLPQSLQKGVVDGAFVPWEIIPALQLQHQTQFQIEGFNNERIGSLLFQTSMNKTRWENLPAEIQKIFKVSTAGKIAGSKVISGEIKSKSKARIIRDGVVVYNGEISTIYREKNQVKEVGSGLECGISVKDFIDFKEKDVIESFLAEEVQRSI